MALGYVRLTPGSGAVPVVAGMEALDAFAASRGWRLGEVFVEDDPGRPLLAWAGLTATACGPERVAAVVVPDVPGLRPEALVLERLRVRCAREIGVPLLLAAVEPDQVAPGWLGAGPGVGARGGAVNMVEVPSPESRRCPFAVGVVVLGTDAPVEDRQTARLAVAIAAYEQGYHLLDLVEAPGGLGGLDEASVGRLWELAARVEAQALFVNDQADGGDTVAVLEPMAAELRMVLRAVDPTASPPPGTCRGAGRPALAGLVGEVVARSVLGLQIPADEGRPVRLTMMRPTASVLSEAIGGGLPTEALTGRVDGSGYMFYLDRHRVVRALPGNQRAAVLAARFGHVTRTWLAGLRGDVLVLGCDERRRHVSVPRPVVDAATQSGLFGPDVDVPP